MLKLVRKEPEIGVDNERRAAAGSSWWPTTTTTSSLEEAGMRKRKEAQAPSVSVDVEEKTPSSAQVSAVVKEEERAPFIKGEKETASV